MMHRDSQSAIPPRRRVLLTTLIVVLVFALLWLVQGFVLGQLALRLLPWLGATAGHTVRIAGAEAEFFAPIVLHGVQVSGPSGTDLEIAEIRFDWAAPVDWGLSPQTWIKRAALRGVRGKIAVTPRPASEVSVDGRGSGQPAHWPSVVEVTEADVAISGAGWALDLRGLELLLDEDRTGLLRVREAIAGLGRHSRAFTDLTAVTAWREGVAYLADLKLDRNVTVDHATLSLVGQTMLTLESRAFGGYAFADVAWDGAGVKAALNALNLSLAGAAAFAGLEGETEGTVALAKLTFNGDPREPLSGQISLRLEAKDFAWRKNAVEELAIGLSVAGGRVRLNECHLRQKSNLVRLRGTITVPSTPSGWREVPFDYDLDAQVGNLRALAALFGPPWNGLSGGLRAEGQGSGQAADGRGWLKVRGWDLSLRGLPPGSLQADLKLEGRDFKLTNLDAQSGSDFLRGGGQLTLDDSLSYQGRLELRIREVARYLQPLGRFAPDWAREGGVLLFWDGDGTASAHSGVSTLELVRFTGDLNPVPVNGKFSGSYAPGNIYISRFLLDRGPLSLSSSLYFGEEGLSVQDIQLFSGRSRLMRGELFLPLSLTAVLARESWEKTVRRERDIYAFVRSDNLDLGALVELFGQETTLRGKADLRLDGSGPWENAAIDGSFSVTGFGAVFPGLTLPEARASLALQVKDRRASFGAKFQPDGSAAVTLQAELPVLGEVEGGAWTLIDQTKPWNAQLEIPPTDLARFSPRIGGVNFDRGLLGGKLQAGATPEAPVIEGSLEWKDGRISFPGDWSPVEAVQAKAVFAGTQAVLEGSSAKMGQGTLGATGSVDLADRRNPRWEILLRGEGLSLYEDDHLLLRGKADLEARGNREGGEVKGTVDLDGSEVRRGVVLTPRLDPVPAAAVVVPLRVTLTPFTSWKLDLKTGSATPLRAGPAEGGGSVDPDLYLQGTLGEPLLLGTLRVANLPVTFASRGKLAAAGAVHFTREQPWVAVLDLVGVGAAGPYNIRAGAFGPLDAQKLFLSTVPPLTKEQIVMLLTTGANPVPTPAPDLAPMTPEAKMEAEPAWLDLDKIRGLFGWGTDAVREDEAAAEGSLGEETVGFGWAWQ
jgi:hypothetical protein